MTELIRDLGLGLLRFGARREQAAARSPPRGRRRQSPFLPSFLQPLLSNNPCGGGGGLPSSYRNQRGLASRAAFVNSVVQLGIFSCTSGLKLTQEYRISSTKTKLGELIHSVY